MKSSFSRSLIVSSALTGGKLCCVFLWIFFLVPFFFKSWRKDLCRGDQHTVLGWWSKLTRSSEPSAPPSLINTVWGWPRQSEPIRNLQLRIDDPDCFYSPVTTFIMLILKLLFPFFLRNKLLVIFLVVFWLHIHLYSYSNWAPLSVLCLQATCLCIVFVYCVLCFLGRRLKCKLAFSALIRQLAVQGVTQGVVGFEPVRIKAGQAP